MQPKVYVPGVAVLLAALLAGCTGSDDPDSAADDRPGDPGATTTVAEPGRYRVLPDPCGVVSHDSLDALLPGIQQITDVEQRETAYEGEATQTFDTDRRAGCRWKVESRTATDHLLVDFERVVSYDTTVSDDSKAEEIYAEKVEAADLPEPSPTASEGEGGPEESAGTGSGTATGEPGESGKPGENGESGDDESPDDTASPSDSESDSESDSPSDSDSDSDSASDSASGSATSSDGADDATGSPSALQPRTLDDLADDAFLDDELSTARQRTVTVVFRTSNVLVTIEYAEQPTTATDVPDSEELQDRARKLAARLAESFEE